MNFDLFLSSPPGTPAAAAVAAVFGLLIGSFLNVVVHRLPKMMQREYENYCAVEAGRSPVHRDRYDLCLPRSGCPKCGHQLSALENIPVISWLMLGGRCSSCGSPISARYPIVELMTAVLSGVVAWRLGTETAGLGALVFLYMLIALSFIDADTQILPDSLTYPLLWIGLLINREGTYATLSDAVVGAAAGYGALWCLNWIYCLFRRREGMGHGDFKLLAALGAWLGWSMLPAVVMMASTIGALFGVTSIIARRKAVSTAIPFGPFLALSGLVCVLFDEVVMDASRMAMPFLR